MFSRTVVQDSDPCNDAYAIAQKQKNSFNEMYRNIKTIFTKVSNKFNRYN